MAYIPPLYPKVIIYDDYPMSQEDQRVYVEDSTPVKTKPINVTLPDARQSFDLTRRFVLFPGASVPVKWIGPFPGGKTFLMIDPGNPVEALPEPDGQGGYRYTTSSTTTATQEAQQQADIQDLKNRMTAIEQSQFPNIQDTTGTSS